MADVFISYAKEDLSSIAELAHALESRGWSVFWDRNIPPGTSWREVIGSELDAARCIVVAWSEHSKDSAWVHEEADEGRERGILVPVLLGDLRPPLGFRHVQAVELFDWNGDQSHAGFQQLAAAVGTLVGTPAGLPSDTESGTSRAGPPDTSAPSPARRARSGSAHARPAAKRLAVGAALALIALIAVFAIPKWTDLGQPASTPPVSQPRPSDTANVVQPTTERAPETPRSTQLTSRGEGSSGKESEPAVGLAPDDFTLLSPFRIKIYVIESSEALIREAKDIKARLDRHLARHGVRPRLEVAPRDSSFFHRAVFPPEGYEIRYEPRGELTVGEREAAEQLRAALSAVYPKVSFRLVPVKNPTPNPNFMSIFLPLP